MVDDQLGRLECVNKALGTSLSRGEYTSRVKMVEILTGNDNNWQQRISGVGCEPDGIDMLVRAEQSSTPTEDAPGLVTGDYNRVFAEGGGHDIAHQQNLTFGQQHTQDRGLECEMSYTALLNAEVEMGDWPNFVHSS